MFLFPLLLQEKLYIYLSFTIIYNHVHYLRPVTENVRRRSCTQTASNSCLLRTIPISLLFRATSYAQPSGYHISDYDRRISMILLCQKVSEQTLTTPFGVYFRPFIYYFLLSVLQGERFVVQKNSTIRTTSFKHFWLMITDLVG